MEIKFSALLLNRITDTKSKSDSTLQVQSWSSYRSETFNDLRGEECWTL